MENKDTMSTASDILTLYVYYKISANQQDSCVLAVKKLQQTIALHYPEVIMQVQKRPQVDTANHETWMEVYADIAPMQLEQMIADLGELAEVHGLPCERKNEVFINLKSP
jgi:hypothetical protein